jgi:hypothetical protein
VNFTTAPAELVVAGHPESEVPGGLPAGTEVTLRFSGDARSRPAEPH